MATKYRETFYGAVEHVYQAAHKLRAGGRADTAKQLELIPEIRAHLQDALDALSEVK